MTVSNMPTFKVQVDFPAGAGEGPWLHFDDPTRGQFDAGKFADANAFVDVTEYVRSITFTSGTQTFKPPYRRADAGHLTVVLNNNDARFDPTNADGPYAVLGTSQVLPMRVVSVRAIFNGGEYPLWRGYTDAWDVDYPMSGATSTVTLQASDIIKVLSAFNGTEQSSQGSGESVYDRFERVVENAGIAESEFQTFALNPLLGGAAISDTPTLNPTTLAGVAWTELQLLSDTAMAELWVDGRGVISIRTRGQIDMDPGSTFSDDAADADALGFTSVDLKTDDEFVYNDVRITRAGGTEQTASDSNSQQDYLVRSFVRRDFINDSDAYSADYAAFVLELYKTPAPRFAAMTFNARESADHATAALVLGIGSRITIHWTPPGRTDPIERDCWIRGMTHNITPSSWIVTYILEDATGYNVLTLDDTGFGRLDYNRLSL